MPYPYKRIPYGIANFMELRQDNYYYVDKTRFIPLLEEMGKALFLIRPRRLGKSLWLSVLANYYDISLKDNFQELFGDLEIAREPTDERNSYLILKFNFSQVDPTPGRVEESFEMHGETVFNGFIRKYKNLFDKDFLTELKSLPRTAAVKLNRLFQYAAAYDHKLFIIIDEYDNFANTILSQEGTTAYHELTHGTGFYRHFFNILKGGTSEEGGGRLRLFITGVSPVTMDDVTSGYNMGHHVSLDARLNELYGFTESEVRAMIAYYRSVGKFSVDEDQSVDVMREWYDRYRFSEETETDIFNTDMVLYFINHVAGHGSMPKHLIDPNVRIDYVKLRHLLTIDRKLNGNFSHLKSIMQTGEAEPRVAVSFPAEQLTDLENFHSLLYYFGLLSFGKSQSGATILRIPNRTVRTLMYGYLRAAYRDVGVFKPDLWTFENLIGGMARDGAWEAVFDFLADAVRAQTTVRDYMQGEKVIQGFLLAYLSVADCFICRSEAELGKGYADFLLEPSFVRYPEVRHGYIVEIKYIPRDTELSVELIEKRIGEAREQLGRYSNDELLRERMGDARLGRLVLVFHGWELVERRAV